MLQIMDCMIFASNQNISILSWSVDNRELAHFTNSKPSQALFD